jgi:hypothetical protein
MLIPHGGGKWSWNDGPICDSQEEALKTASIPVSDETVTTCIVDMQEPMELDDE